MTRSRRSPKYIAWSGGRIVLLGTTVSLGTVLYVLAYETLSPLLVAGILGCLGYICLLLPIVGGREERETFLRVFCVGFLAASVAACYAELWFDQSQLRSDAVGFFDLSSGGAAGTTIADLRLIHEGALAIVIWALAYDGFAALGVPKAPYVGILVNVTVVALSAVMGTRMVGELFGYDAARLKRFRVLVCGCGLLWLFAGLHLRDAFVLFVTTAITYSWVHFVGRPGSIWAAVQLAVVSSSAIAAFGVLRGVFVFVPAAMAVTGVIALALGRSANRHKLSVYMAVLIGIPAVGYLTANLGGALDDAMTMNRLGYQELVLDQHSSTSLGATLIVNQPIPIRAVVGSAYLFLTPIPFWAGFQVVSAYDLFKSLNAIFIYLLIPLLVRAAGLLVGHRELRSPGVLFVSFVSVGFTVAVAVTSLETRHFGAFLMPIFAWAVLPDPAAPGARVWYQRLLWRTLIAVGMVHAVWAILKWT